jgi:hypothetical protein
MTTELSATAVSVQACPASGNGADAGHACGAIGGLAEISITAMRRQPAVRTHEPLALAQT